MYHNFKFDIGDEVKDQVTGFVGIITGMAHHITGCDTYVLTPNAQNNALGEPYSFDENRLTLIKEKKVEIKDSTKKKGASFDLAKIKKY
jgi:hypothetical protein